MKAFGAFRSIALTVRILDQIYKPGCQILQFCLHRASPYSSFRVLRPSIPSVASDTSFSHSKLQRPFAYLNKCCDVNLTTPLLGRTRLPSSFQLLQRTPVQRPLYRAGAPTSEEKVLTMPGQSLSSFVRPIIAWLTNPSLESGEYEHPFNYPKFCRLSNLGL